MTYIGRGEAARETATLANGVACVACMLADDPAVTQDDLARVASAGVSGPRREAMTRV